MATYVESGTRSRTFSLVALVVVAAILYLARDVLIPLVVAILLSFLLAPAVTLLERWHLGRVPATAVIVLLGFSIIGAVGWFAASQAVSLAARLPEYRENISAKIRALRAPSEGTLGQAAEAIRDLEEEAAPEQPPLAVKETAATPLAALMEWTAPFAKPLGMALAVIIFTILMLLNREDMRDRLIGLIGAGRINLTTQAFGEAAQRVSRYLLMQLVVNAGFGIPFGIALYFIGIPNAMLWGLLVTLLRFIPYAGIWIAIAMPLTLAFAISDGWSLVAWTVGVFLAFELIFVYGIEPWLYGRSTGLSPIAIIAAVVFWTWLWGPVGLLLATPLTVCVAVMGRYIPEFGFLNVLLGVEPVLTPEARLYQRLIALDDEEAIDVSEEYANEHGLLALHQAVVIPALGLAEQDRHRGVIDEARERCVFDTVRKIIEDVEDRKAMKEEAQRKAEEGEAKSAVPGAPAARGAVALCIVGAHDEADHLAGLAFARVLAPADFDAQVIGFPVLAGEIVDRVAESSAKIVCISAVPPQAAIQAGYLIKRLKSRLPEAKVLVVIWTSEDIARARARLGEAGADKVVSSLPDAIAQLHELSGQ
ncbi:MAG TPA: AI-2E family transporter [Burkholderiales bacterium]|nr:AI-2E family transporter [Burkholderiales bacterium]